MGPNDVTRSAGAGDRLFFGYDPNLIVPPEEALFLSVLTDAPSFDQVGTITIFAQTDFGADVFQTTLTGTNAPTPEPSALVLAGVGLLCLLSYCRRRKS